MHIQSQDRRPVLVLVGLLFLLGVVGESDAAPADARVVRPSSGRTAPETSDTTVRPADWFFDVGAGISAAGDLFRAKSDATEMWTAPVSGETFAARRFTVTLDETARISAGLARRITGRGWLHLNFTWFEMNATALANDSQFVSLVPYDVLTFTSLGLTWEERLTDTDLAPFVLAGATWLDVSARSDALSQSSFAPVFGAGVSWRLQGGWVARADLTDTLVQIDSDDVVDTDWPVQATHAEIGPQHLIGIEIGLSVAF